MSFSLTCEYSAISLTGGTPSHWQVGPVDRRSTYWLVDRSERWDTPCDLSCGTSGTRHVGPTLQPNWHARPTRLTGTKMTCGDMQPNWHVGPTKTYMRSQQTLKRRKYAGVWGSNPRPLPSLVDAVATRPCSVCARSPTRNNFVLITRSGAKAHFKKCVGVQWFGCVLGWAGPARFFFFAPFFLFFYVFPYNFWFWTLNWPK